MMSRTSLKWVGALLTVACLSACAKATIRPNGGPALSSSTAPNYEESKPYFMWGLVGEHDINVKQVCGEKDVEQMQSRTTFVDGLLTLFTLGIYSPKTAMVWCK
jgi:hypothetical protein